MCLAIPMRVIAIDGFNARVEAKGIERDVSLFMLQHEEIAPGDMLMIHAGHALQKMTEDEARLAWEAYDELLAAGYGMP